MPKSLKDLLGRAVRQPYDDRVMGVPATGGPIGGEAIAEWMRKTLPANLGAQFGDSATVKAAPVSLDRLAALKRKLNL